jgi:hypothetical protein
MRRLLNAFIIPLGITVFVLVIALTILLPGGAVGWCIRWFVPSVEPGAGMGARTFGLLTFVRGPYAMWNRSRLEGEDDGDADGEDDDESDSLTDDEIVALREFARSIAASAPAGWSGGNERVLPELTRRKRRR